MTMINEAVRLFFAISALVLVGMLAGSEEPNIVPALSAQLSQAAPAKSPKLASTEKKRKLAAVQKKG